MFFSQSVYKAQCATFSVACSITGDTRTITKGSDYLKPPFCLRIVRQYRTPEMQQFRDLVARTIKEQRAAD